jgi:hypothetical protein
MPPSKQMRFARCNRKDPRQCRARHDPVCATWTVSVCLALSLGTCLYWRAWNAQKRAKEGPISSFLIRLQQRPWPSHWKHEWGRTGSIIILNSAIISLCPRSEYSTAELFEQHDLSTTTLPTHSLHARSTRSHSERTGAILQFSSFLLMMSTCTGRYTTQTEERRDLAAVHKTTYGSAIVCESNLSWPIRALARARRLHDKDKFLGAAPTCWIVRFTNRNNWIDQLPLWSGLTFDSLEQPPACNHCCLGALC